MEQNKPYSIQAEMTRGCNKACGFCSIHNLPKEKQFMTLETARAAARALKWAAPMRIEFAMRGEPTLNPDWQRIIQAFRQEQPGSQLTLITNGLTLEPDKARGFYLAGGNIIFMDCYGDTYETYRERFKEFHPRDYYSGEFNVYQMHPPATRALVLMRDISQVSGTKTTRVLSNQAGNVDYARAANYGIEPLRAPLPKMCTKPFRELAVFYNGDISFCCNDWQATTILGNVHQGPGQIRDMWYDGEPLNKARTMLYNRNRDFGICRQCDDTGGFRVGLVKKHPATPAEQQEITQEWRDRYGI